MNRQSTIVGLWITGINRVDDLKARSESLKWIIERHPPSLARKRVLGRFAYEMHPLVDKACSIIEGHLICTRKVGQVDLEPVEPTRTERLGFLELKHASTQIGTHVRQVWRDRVCPPAKVDVVGEEYLFVVFVFFRLSQLQQNRASERSQIHVLLYDSPVSLERFTIRSGLFHKGSVCGRVFVELCGWFGRRNWLAR